MLFFPHFTANQSGKAAGTFTGIGLSTTKEDIVRAVMEGIAYVLAAQVKQHERIGNKVREIRLFGGGAASTTWRQIISDMTKLPVLLPATHETACLGAAILAAKGAGMIEDIYHPDKLLKEPACITLPNLQQYEKYQVMQQRYDELNSSVIRNVI